MSFMHEYIHYSFVVVLTSYFVKSGTENLTKIRRGCRANNYTNVYTNDVKDINI